MYSTVFTAEYDKVPRYSTALQTYFKNRLTKEIIAESKSNGGYDYYRCTPEQMHLNLVGDYIGCVRSNKRNPEEADLMNHNPETHIPKTLNLNDEDFLD